MEVYSRISRLARYLDLARRKAFLAHDLEPWEFDVLSSLRRAAEPYSLTPGSLMAELLVSSGTITNRIDRLERRGYVRRTRSEFDRRGVLITLTEAGRQQVDRALEQLLIEEKRLLKPLNQQQIGRLKNLLRELLLSFEGTPIRPFR